MSFLRAGYRIWYIVNVKKILQMNGNEKYQQNNKFRRVKAEPRSCFINIKQRFVLPRTSTKRLNSFNPCNEKR